MTTLQDLSYLQEIMAIKPLQYGHYYHIYNRGNNRENLFVEQRNYAYFLKLYARHILPIADTFAYCLLPNHFHLLIRTRTEAEQETYWREQLLPYGMAGARFKLRKPSEAYKNLFIAYTRAFNKATGRTGTLFERPFHRKPVQQDSYFYNLLAYIHRNPQRHGLIDDFRDWKWSSLSAYESEGETRIARDDALAWFGNRADFIEAHRLEVTNLQDLSLLGDEEDQI